MAVDYDVVIIGGSLAGRDAALVATQLRATVALVEPGGVGERTLIQSPHFKSMAPQIFGQIGKVVQQLNDAKQFGLQASPISTTEDGFRSVLGDNATQWAKGVVSNLEEYDSPSILASRGVDVIIGNGQFQASPNLAFSVNERLLRARTYLLIPPSRPAIPNIEGLQSTGYFTPQNVWQQLNFQKLPKNWVIIGGDLSSIQFAQTLTRLGLNVILVMKGSHILTKEDPEVAQLIQATLETEGVRILTQMPVTQVKQIQDKKWIQVGNEAIETDEILVVTGQVPNVASLNLEAVGVKFNRHGLVLNEKLQTTNPHIYACGEAINGDELRHIANYEARIALNNALFFPLFKVNYHCIPWAIFSDPVVARVGLTAAQARQQYNDDILVLKQYFKFIAAAQMREETTGLCQLVVRPNGEILGAALVGPEAEELIQVIALAIRQKLKVKALTQLAPIYPSLSEILSQTAALWNQQRLRQNIQLQNFLESFFNLRRSWSK